MVWPLIIGAVAASGAGIWGWNKINTPSDAKSLSEGEKILYEMHMKKIEDGNLDVFYDETNKMLVDYKNNEVYVLSDKEERDDKEYVFKIATQDGNLNPKDIYATRGLSGDDGVHGWTGNTSFNNREVHDDVTVDKYWQMLIANKDKFDIVKEKAAESNAKYVEDQFEQLKPHAAKIDEHLDIPEGKAKKLIAEYERFRGITMPNDTNIAYYIAANDLKQAADHGDMSVQMLIKKSFSGDTLKEVKEFEPIKLERREAEKTPPSREQSNNNNRQGNNGGRIMTVSEQEKITANSFTRRQDITNTSSSDKKEDGNWLDSITGLFDGEGDGWMSKIGGFLGDMGGNIPEGIKGMLPIIGMVAASAFIADKSKIPILGGLGKSTMGMMMPLLLIGAVLLAGKTMMNGQEQGPEVSDVDREGIDYNATAANNIQPVNNGPERELI